MKTTNIAAAILAGTAVLVASPAFAGSTVAGNTIAVGLTIQDQCTISAPASLSFGSHGIILSNVDSTADITIECTKETPYSIALDDGENAADAVNTTRSLKNADGDYIDYELYRDSNRTNLWGSTVGTGGVPGNTVDSASAAGADEVITIFGRVPSHQNQPIGTYADHVTATIWYAAQAAN